MIRYTKWKWIVYIRVGDKKNRFNYTMKKSKKKKGTTGEFISIWGVGLLLCKEMAGSKEIRKRKQININRYELKVEFSDGDWT